jgi:glycosyltransferase involved in cell wall biosynthesis
MTKGIVYVASGSGYGGTAVALHHLIKHLDRKAFQPFVFVYGVGSKIEEIKKKGVSVRVLRNYYPIPQIKTADSSWKNLIETPCFYANFFSTCIINGIKISRIIKKENISLVHLNNGIIDNFEGLVAAMLCGVPCISHVRGTEPLTKLERMFGWRIKKMITLNSTMHELYSSVFGADKSCIIFEGVDLDSFEHVDRGKIRREFQIPNDLFLVGTVARLIARKGISEFIRAAAQVIRVNPKVVFFVIGDDPLSSASVVNKFRQLAMDLGVAERIVFTGWRDDVIDLMSGLDLVVQVSILPEGMSLVPIEAMALGKPVIASNVPGYTDTVEDGMTGFIVPPGDVEALTKKILEFSMDGDLERLGANGRQKVLRQFDVRIAVAKVQMIYDRILS